MIDTKLNAAIGRELRAMQERRRKSTLSLARYLGIPRQEMLQILQGSKLPTESQLESLFYLLAPEQKTVMNLRLLLMEAVKSACNTGSWDPGELKKRRLERKLSLPMLALRTGIPTTRLEELECADNGANPSDDEAVSLSKIFHQPGVLTFYEPASDQYRPSFPRSGGIPLVTLGDMKEFLPDSGLSSFAEKASVCDLQWSVDCSGVLAAVAADASDLQLQFPGIVILAVTEKTDDRMSACFLCCDGNGRYSLQKCEDGIFSPVKWTCPAAVAGEMTWALPVVDIVIKPLESLGDFSL